MKHIHFIAIGGAVMHQLALALHRQGHVVTGSDDDINDPAKTNLQQAGLLPESVGWFAEKISKQIDIIVLGMHAKADNPELIAAQALGIPVFSFPEYVYEVCKNKKRVVIAGSHGKTTITSMVMHVLKAAGLDFDYLVGAKVPGFDSSVRLSDAPIIVLEGDEYPASVIERRPKIFFYQPHITLLSGVAWDHINVFPTYENYKSQFQHFVQHLEQDSSLIYNDEDAEVMDIVASCGTHLKRLPYRTPNYKYDGMEPILQTDAGEYRLQVFGKHNLLNLAGAKRVCNELGISDAKFYEAIKTYTGAARRLEKIFERDGLMAYRDFAHAPSKLKATLSAVREAMHDKYLIAIFELHTYSSLSDAFLSQYKDCINDADRAIVYYSSHALHIKGLPAIAKENIHHQFHREDLLVINQPDELKTTLTALLQTAPKPCCLLLMSSGTFDGVEMDKLLEHLSHSATP